MTTACEILEPAAKRVVVVVEPSAKRSEQFAERILKAFNDASMMLLISVGHRTGLFDAMSVMEPASSVEIARHCGLHERYVREWLGGMVVSGVVEYDPKGETYSLPAEHAAMLTRAAAPSNMAVMASYLPVMASVEDEVIAAFKSGGGVPYSFYPRLQEVMAEDSGAVIDASLVSTTLPLVPGLMQRLEQGIDVADVGCGAGHAVNTMARAFPNSRFVGYDISTDGITRGREEAKASALRNARFDVSDIAALGETDRFGLVTAFDVIHDQAQPTQVLRAIADALTPDGVFLMVDFAASSRLEENVDHPFGPALYTFSVMHCMTVSLAQGGAGLGTVWGEQKALEMLSEAGFGEIRVERVEDDPFNNYYVAHRA
jgi:2-polyprenyl-3-methyl-5-hydroxy-6-metoxy-1,4-benzoquinol methylase